MNDLKLSIPRELYQKLSQRAANDKQKVEDCILEIIKKELENSAKNPGKDKKEAYTESDEEKVKERLRSLGYLD